MKSSISQQSNLNLSLQPQSEKIPSDFWKAIRTNIKSQHLAPPIKPVPRYGNLTLSFAQERLWFIDQLQPDSSIHNMRAAFLLKGSLNVAVLEQSLREIVRRHEILRTTFAAVDGMPVQVISPYIDLKLPVIDLIGVPDSERDIQVEQITRQEFEQPFDLAKVPLWRFKLLRLAEEEYLLLRTVHHIIFDGWSYSVFMRELAVIYEAFSTGKPLPLKELPIQYADFAQSQRQWLEGEVLESQLNYWKQQLSGSISPLELPIDHIRPSIPTYRGARQILVLPKDLTEKLKALSAQEEVSLFVTLLAAFKTLLYRYTGQEDMIVCSPIAGRNRVETKKLIGYFNNILPMRTYLGENPSFRELMGRVSQVTLGAYEHQDLPFQKLMDCSNIPSTSLYRGMFALQNTPSQPLKLGEINISYPDVDSDTSNFDLFLSLTEGEGNITAVLTFKTDLFNSSTITQMLENFQTLLESLVANPNQHLSDLPLLRCPESHQQIDQPVKAAYVAPQKEIERTIVAVWQEVFQLEKVGIHDNFFALGGHSLLATQIISSITSKLQTEIQLNLLFEKPTIDEIASYVESKLKTPHSKNKDEETSVIIINRNGTKTPLYFINSTTVANDLNNYLDGNQPLYSLNIFGLTKRIEKPFEQLTIQDFAQYIIQDLLRFQPNGPYNLIGYCQDGALTLEIVQQLKNQGYTVNLLALIDVIFQGQKATLFDRLLLIKEFKLTYLKPRFKRYFKEIKKKIFQRQIKEKNQQNEELEIQEKVQLDRELYHAYLSAAFKKYQPSIYDGKIVSFLSQEWSYKDQSSLEIIAQNGLNLCKIDSLHNTLFDEPYIELFAKKLRDYLD